MYYSDRRVGISGAVYLMGLAIEFALEINPDTWIQ